MHIFGLYRLHRVAILQPFISHNSLNYAWHFIPALVSDLWLKEFLFKMQFDCFCLSALIYHQLRR